MAAALDNFQDDNANRLRNPCIDGFAITPSDTVDCAAVTRKVYVGGAGALTVITKAGTTLTFAAVPAGTTIDLRISRVMATGTVATSIVGLV